MRETDRQMFDDAATTDWRAFEGLPGVDFVPLAEPVRDGSIHRARLSKGTIIPPHTHPSDEYVFVVSGVVETGGRRCEAGAFWSTPANVRQGPHVAVTDAQILTIRLGGLGSFES